MSRTIDEKVVEMKFDNSNFESNVKTSMSTLERLKASIKTTESAKAFSNIDKAANKVNFGSLNKGIDEVKARISGLDMIANTVLSRMTNSVIDFGTKIFTAIPNQIKSGGWNRATNIDQAKFQLKGLKTAWDDIYGDIDYAVSGTAYGLDAAARAASQLVASNVTLGDNMKKALRGISGVAAMTSSSYDEIAHIFTSAAGTGKVMALQLNEIANRGLNAKAAIADMFNEITTNGENADKVSEEVQKQVKSLTKGVLVNEQAITDFVSKGKINFSIFSEAMDLAYGEHAKAANETFEGALANIRSALSRTGEPYAASIRKNLIGPFNEIRLIINSINSAIKPAARMFDFLATKVFSKITDKLAIIREALGETRTQEALIEGVSAAIHGLYERLQMVAKAFGEVFGFATTDSIYDMAVAFADFMDDLMPTKEELETIHYIFKGIFNIVKLLGKGLKFVLLLLTKLGPKLTPIVTIGGTLLLAGTAASRFASKLASVGQFLKPLLPLFGLFGKALLVVAAIIGGGLGIKYLIENFDKVKEKLSEVKENIKSFASDFKAQAKEAFDSFVASAKEWYAKLGESHPLLKSFLSVVVGFGKTIGMIFQGIGEAFKKLPTLFNLGGWEDVFNKISGGLANFRDNVGKIGVGDKIISGFTKLKNALTSFGEVIKKYFGDTKLFKNITGFIDKIKNLFKKNDELVAESHEVSDKINMSSGKSLKETTETLDGYIEATDEASSNTKTFGEKIEEFKSKIDVGKIALVTFSTAFLSLAAGIGRATWGFGNLTDSVSRYVDTFNLKKLFGISVRKIRTALTDIALVIASVAASLWVLSTIPADRLQAVTNALMTFILVCGGLALVLSIFEKKIGPGGNSAAFLGVAVGVAAMIAALWILDKVPMENIKEKLITLVVMVGIISAVMIAMSRLGGERKISRMGFNMIGLGLALLAMAKALNEVNSLTGSPEQILAKVLAMCAVIAALGLAASGIGQIRFTTGIGLLLTIAALKQVAPEIKAFVSSFKISDLDKFLEILDRWKIAFGLLGGVATALIVGLGIAGKGISKIGLGVLLFAASIGVLAFSIGYLGNKITELKQNKKVLLATLGIVAFMGVLFLALTKAATQYEGVGQHAIKLAIMIATVATSMIIIGGAIAIISSLFKEGGWQSVAAVVGAAAIIAAMMLIVKELIIATKSVQKVKLGKLLTIFAGLSVIFLEIIALAAMFKADGVSAAMGVLSMIGVIAVLGLLFSNIKKLDSLYSVLVYKQIIAIGVVVGILMGTLITIAALGERVQWQNLLATAVSMGIVIATLALLFRSLSKVPADIMPKAKAFKETIFALIPVMAALAGLSAIGGLTNTQSEEGFKNVIAAAASLAGIVFAMVGAFKWLQSGKIPLPATTEQFAKACLSVLPVAGAIAGLAVAGHFTDHVLDSTFIIGGMIVGMAFTLKQLAEHTNGLDIVATASAFSIACLSLIEAAGAIFVATYAIAKGGNTLNGVNSLIGCILVVAVGLSTVASVTSSGDLIATAAALDIACLSLIEVAASIYIMSQIINDIPKEAFNAMTTFMEVIFLMMTITTLLSEIISTFTDPLTDVGLDAILLSIGAAFALMGAGALEVGVGLFFAGDGLLRMGAALNRLVPLIERLSDSMNVMTMGKLLELAKGLTAIGKAGIVCEIGAAGIVAMSRAITKDFIDAIVYINNIDDSVFTTLGTKIKEFADAIKPLSNVSIGLMFFGLAVKFFGEGIESAANGLYIATESLPKLTSAFRDLKGEDFNKSSKAIDDLAWGLVKLGWAGGMLFNNVAGLYVAAWWLPTVINALNKLPQGDTTIADSLKAMGDGLTSLAWAGVVLNFGKNGLLVGAAGVTLMAYALKMLPSPTEMNSINSSITKLSDSSNTLAWVGLKLKVGAGGFIELGVGLLAVGKGLESIHKNYPVLESEILKIAEVTNLIDPTAMQLSYEQLGSWIPTYIMNGIDSTAGELLSYCGQLASDMVAVMNTELAKVGTGSSVSGAEKVMADTKEVMNKVNYSGGAKQYDIHYETLDPTAATNRVRQTGQAIQSEVQKVNQNTDVIVGELYNSTIPGNTKTVDTTHIEAETQKLGAAGARAGASVATTLDTVADQNYKALSGANKTIDTTPTVNAVATVGTAIKTAGQANVASANVLSDQTFHGLSARGKIVDTTSVASGVQSVGNTIEREGTSVKAKTSGLIDGVLGFFGNITGIDTSGIASAVDSFGGTIFDHLEPVYDGVKGAVSQIGEWLGFSTRSAAQIKANVETARSYVKQLPFMNSLASTTGSMVKDSFDKISQGAKSGKEHTNWLNETLDEFEKTAEEAKKSAEDFTDGLGDMGSAAKGAGGDMNSLSDTIANQIDLFSEFNMKTEMTGEQMLNNMRSQIQGVSQWAANMQQLALRGMAPGLLKKLGDLGPQGYEKVAAFMQMTQEQLAEANQLYATSLVLPGFAANQVEGSYAYAGQMAAQGFMDGLGGYQAGFNAASPFGQGTIGGIETPLQINSPSRKLYQTGQFAMMGLNNGMKAQAPYLQSTTKTIATMIGTKFKEYFMSPEFTTMAGMIPQLLVNGLAGQQGQVMGAATGLIDVSAMFGAFTYEAGLLVLADFIQGIKDFIATEFGIEDETSKYSMDLVMYFMQGILDGCEEYYEGFEEQLLELFLTPLEETFDDYLGREKFVQMGKDICQGLIDGIDAMLPSVKAKAQELAEAVNNTATGKKGFDINSPSHVFQRIGKSIDEGLALGISQGTSMPVRQIGELTDDVSARMNTVISTITGMMNSNMDMTPTIRPVLDTSNVAYGVNAINGMFNGANAAIAATSYADSIKARTMQLELSKMNDSKLQASYTQALIDAVNASAQTDTNVNVVLAGDAGKVFNLVRTENSKFTKSTGYNPLAQGRG